MLRFSCFIAALLLLTPLGVSAAIVPLHVRGEDFADSGGKPVRFWGVNLVACYPTHDVADKLAANLASRQINLVRPHHMLRPSADWVVKGAPIVALQDYKSQTTRKPDPEAWDRFDYLNAALRRNDIYLMLSVWWTRRYLPGDVDVLQTNDADRKAWMEGIAELNSWHWKKAFDPRKILCVVDDRAAALEEEFARQLLTHVNPYTGVSYGQDPQVLTLELQNECSSEYIFVCQNKFPDYFQKKLLAKWEAFAREAGVEPGDFYKPAGPRLVAVRSKFLRKLDEDYLNRMKSVVQSTGSRVSVAFSNLWEGENAQQMYAQNNGHIEDHCYADPMVVNKASDLLGAMARSQIAGKPYFVGELNTSENQKLLAQQLPVRTMLPLAAAAYGSLQNWSGIVYFAWVHGDRQLGADGWGESEFRDLVPPAGDYGRHVGNMITDGMQIDHLRTCGIMFRRGLVDRSVSPIILHVDEPYSVADYNGLMRGKYVIKPGWQNIHGIRKVYGPAPSGQSESNWLTQDPSNPYVSDTQQIIKDIQRKQLTVAAPGAEAFSGYLDASSPSGLKHLQLTGDGFATVVMVADDNLDLGKSARLIISRTHVTATGNETDGPAMQLAGLQTPRAGQQWRMRVTRPREMASDDAKSLSANGDAPLVLPDGAWHECELELK